MRTHSENTDPDMNPLCHKYEDHITTELLNHLERQSEATANIPKPNGINYGRSESHLSIDKNFNAELTSDSILIGQITQHFKGTANKSSEVVIYERGGKYTISEKTFNGGPQIEPTVCYLHKEVSDIEVSAFLNDRFDFVHKDILVNGNKIEAFSDLHNAKLGDMKRLIGLQTFGFIALEDRKINQKTSMNKVPIIGRVSNSKEVKAFRDTKMQLKERNYPIGDTLQFVLDRFEKMADKLDGVISKDSILITVPSGSGINRITGICAQLISERFGASILSEGLIMKKHKLEAKSALTLEKRVHDPISYGIYSGEIKKEVAGKDVFILDDLIATGESSVKVKKTLEAYDIRVNGYVNLVTVENRFPSINDLNRLMEKIAVHKIMTPKEKESFWKDLDTVFSDYTRQKINRVEREVRSNLSAIGAYQVIKKAAEVERQIGQSLKQQIQLSI